jgi:hypothetical protein
MKTYRVKEEASFASYCTDCMYVDSKNICRLGGLTPEQFLAYRRPGPEQDRSYEQLEDGYLTSLR